jgi:hypothetical protein
MCCLLGSMVACLLVPCTFQERSRDMVNHNCLGSLTDGLKQATEFCMIAHIYHDLYQGVLVWFCSLALELELAHSGAVHPANSPMAGPGASASDRAQHLGIYKRPLRTKRKSGSEHFVMVGDEKGSHFTHLLCNVLHLTLQARCLDCSGCQFELKQVSFTAIDRPSQCLLTSRNTLFLILIAGLLEPHGCESCTWHNRDRIRTLCI